MKIVQVAPDYFPLPPAYGGIERMVYDLTEELVRHGHEVYLYAPQGTVTNAHLIPYKHKGRGKSYNKIAHYLEQTLPSKVDIIHDHTHYSVIGKRKLKIPTICTIHIPINNKVDFPVYVSRRALELHGQSKGFYIYNGLQTDDFGLCTEKKGYLLFIGRISQEKGVHHAIEVAVKTNKSLILAGPIFDEQFFHEEISPKLSRNEKIRYIGEVGGAAKCSLLQHAECLLFPSLWEEPFGLAMVEAMACGTPVMALNNGAVAEVLAGFPEQICTTVEEMVRKVEQELYPASDSLTQYVAKNFTVSRMAADYLELYTHVMDHYFRRRKI